MKSTSQPLRKYYVEFEDGSGFTVEAHYYYNDSDNCCVTFFTNEVFVPGADKPDKRPHAIFYRVRAVYDDQGLVMPYEPAEEAQTEEHFID